jgi:hypothetical protein
MMQTPITRTVYAAYFPETQKIVDELWNSRPHAMYEDAFTGKQTNLHLPFLDQWRQWSGVELGDQFPYAYPANGASEGIKDLIMPFETSKGSILLSELVLQVPPARLHIFSGEYEGYKAIAEERGMEVVEHRRNLSEVNGYDFSPTDMFWVSNPSAIDGEYWDELDEWLITMERRHPQVRIYLDVTYIGAVRIHRPLYPARHPNIAAVIFSLSKPMGVYYHRIGGVFSRRPVGTLWGNAWFKNLFSIELGRVLMERYTVDDLPRRYAPVQAEAVRRLITDGTLPSEANPSNVVLLARSPIGTKEYQRAEGNYRFCLTPTILNLIKG